MPERLPYGEDPNQFLDFRWAKSPARRPLLIMIHGGFWRSRFDLSHSANLCEGLTRAGYHTANIEYRRLGQAGGGWPGTLNDVLAAVRFARAHVDAPAAVIGHSAGGHLALWLAAELPDLAVVVALAPVASLRLGWERNLGNGAVRDFLGGSPEEVPERYAAADPAVRPSRVARILIHGSADDIVPLELSRAYVASRSQDIAPARLVELPGADHFTVIDPENPALRAALPQA
jgi:acetyl esterase/lipase